LRKKGGWRGEFWSKRCLGGKTLAKECSETRLNGGDRKRIQEQSFSVVIVLRMGERGSRDKKRSGNAGSVGRHGGIGTAKEKRRLKEAGARLSRGES